MSDPAYSCSGRTFPAGSLGLERICHMGNAQGKGGGKAVATRLNIFLAPCLSENQAPRAQLGLRGGEQRGNAHCRVQEEAAMLLPYLNTGH